MDDIHVCNLVDASLWMLYAFLCIWAEERICYVWALVWSKPLCKGFKESLYILSKPNFLPHKNLRLERERGNEQDQREIEGVSTEG